jgi:hypothetical protein
VFQEEKDNNLSSFREWLAAQGKRKWTVREIVIFAKRFGHVLETGDASELAALSPANRKHALSALASLSKYQGRYEWLRLRQRYDLKWSRGGGADSIQYFERIFNDELTFDVMLQRVKEMIQNLPVHMGNIIKFNCLTGLRPAEAVESVKLLNDKEAFAKYYNPGRNALEHFRFPDIFLRQTKNAYISFVGPEMLALVQQLDKKLFLHITP